MILTNDGTARYTTEKHRTNGWYGTARSEKHRTNGWYLCFMDGVIPHCADDGRFISEADPTEWMPIPPRNEVPDNKIPYTTQH